MHRQIATSFVRQFKHMTSMLTVAIDRCPDELWSRGATKASASPSEIAYHAVVTLAMPHILNIPADQLPHCPGEETRLTRDDVKALLSDISVYVASHYQNLTDAEILSREREDTPDVQSFIYALRHAQYNVGMFVQVLKENGIKPPAWSSANMM